MKHTGFFKRLLSVLLMVALVAGNVLPAMAIGTNESSTSGTNVSFTQVDNSEVSAGLTPSGRTEITDEGEYTDTDMVRVSIVLTKKSTIDAGYSPMDITSNQGALQYRESLKKDQTNMIYQIEKTIKSNLDVVWNLTLAANIISANVQYGQINEIRNLSGVKEVFLENQYLPCQTEDGTVDHNMATSGEQIGTAPVWAEGYTGAGMRIAVIDTGIDTDHQSLNDVAFEYALSQLAEQKGMSKEDYIASLDLLDAAEIAAVADDLNVSIDPQQVYVNSKIAFGYNYRDFDYDVTHDNDEEGDHGSHVAGIAAANSWLVSSDGVTFGKALEEVLMQGVAPEAQLLALKVFGKNGSPYDSDFFAAIEDAIVLGADAINLSLGSTAPGRSHHSNDQLEQIMTSLTNSGVVVSISAGNSGSWVEDAANGGYLYNTDVSMDTLGQPGAFTNSLCVASVENDGMVGYYFTVDDEVIVYIEELFNDMKSLTTLAGEQEYIFIDGVGTQEDWAALADVLPGKIAICSRGEINFTEKARLAVEAGAIAVMIYNNANGIIYMDMTEFAGTAPVVFLTQMQGATVREKSTPVYDSEGNLRYLTGTMNIADSIGKGVFASEYYTMSDFSSWGVTGSLEIKPEITAPGGNIYSLEGLNPSGGAYAIKSGTSMAAPQVAGMAALLMQYISENDLDEKTDMDIRHLAQSLLMSTATPILADEDTYYSILQQGAGLANIQHAINADSFITMAPGSSAGAADGKVKVELYDDPDREGVYSATFTIHNLQDEAKSLVLNADFFIQSPFSSEGQIYMDTVTEMIGMDVVWKVDGQEIIPAKLVGLDFNGDGKVAASDGQHLLDYATGVTKELSNRAEADIDGDGDIDSHDAYLFLRELVSISATLPANGETEVTVSFSLTEEMKAMLDAAYPNGTYIQGYLFAETESTEEGVSGTCHSIPVLGFYGNWTDSSMFEVGRWTTYANDEDTRIPYTGVERTNDFKVRYAKDPNYHYSFGGNPVIPDSVYMPERNAFNSSDYFHGISFAAIRNADQSRVMIVNETTGEVLLEQKTGAVNMAYYLNDLYGWQNAGMMLETNVSLKSASEDDEISVEFTLVPEYYIDSDGNVDWDALGDGATMSTSFVIDNTAPVLEGVSVDLLNNTMTIVASDNQYIAAAGIYNKTGTRQLAATGAKQDIGKGETAEYTFSLDKINGKKFLVQVFDYAMNASTYMVEMQIGDEVGVPDMMAYDLIQNHWTTFTKDFTYNYKVGTPRLAYSDFVFYAATIAEHYVFASTNKGNLYVMPEDDMTDTSFIVNLGTVLYDMAYNKADGEIYAVTENNDLVTIGKLTGEMTKIGKIGVSTNTLACDADGTFYCNELGTGKVYSFTLSTMGQPTLLMEDPFLTKEDPIYGDMGGTTGNMGMEYDPNTGMICWNSHCEVLVGSYITMAYYYEIDPKTGEFTRYNDFWHEMSCLMIPDETDRNDSWAKPTEIVTGVSLNQNALKVIKGTTAQLTANVQPWTAVDRTVTWFTSDASVATVDQNGVVTGVAPGTATITARSTLDPTKYAVCNVTVELLQVTINGTVADENGQSVFYSWNMATDNTWKPGKNLPTVMTSATWSTLGSAFYMMDATDALQMHKIDAQGNILATASNANGIPLWDMSYSETFSTADQEMINSIYYCYLLSPKDPMALDAVGFDLSSMCSYMVGITSFGSESVQDTEGNEYDTEHLVMLDNDGYIWHFWIFAQGTGYNALYSINSSNLNCEFPGDETMEHMFTSLMAGEDGNLYLSAFNGSTNELYLMSYDENTEQYNAVKIGEMGADVWPASITSVTVNSGNTTTAVQPIPTHTMSSTEISKEQLAAASRNIGKTAEALAQEEKTIKLNLLAKDDQVVTNDAGDSKTDTIALSEGENQFDITKMVYYHFTAPEAGTVSMSIGTSTGKWYAMYYPSGADGSYTTIENAQPAAAEVAAGDSVVIGIRIYDTSKWSAVAGTLTINVQFTAAGGTTPDPDPTDPTDPTPSKTLALGKNDLTSGVEYTYVVPEDTTGRMEFSVGSVYNSAGSKQYSWYNGSKVQILINGKAMTASSKKLNVTAGQEITVKMNALDSDSYTCDITLTNVDAAETLALGQNNIAQDLEYVYTATQDGTLYFSVVEMFYNDEQVTADALGSSVLMTINGASISTFEKSYTVNTGDEIAVIIEDYSWDGSGTVSAKVNLSYEGFYQHPVGSLNNPVELLYASCPTETIEIAAGTAVWYELESYYDDSSWSTVYPFDGRDLIVTGQNAYVIVGSTRYDAVNGVVTARMDETTLIQIGNDGTSAAAFNIAVQIPEGDAENPKDLVEGDNTVELARGGSFSYDFAATQDGTATVSISGEYWKVDFFHYDANGSQLATESRLATNGDSNVFTVEMEAGESIVLNLSTKNGYSYPGGTLTANFHFEPAGEETPCTHSNATNTWQSDDTNHWQICGSCGETFNQGAHSTGEWQSDDTNHWKVCGTCNKELDKAAHSYSDGECTCGKAEPAEEPENSLVLGTNALASGKVYTYTVTEDSRLEFDFVVKDSNGSTVYQYAYGRGTRLKIMINGKYIANLADTRISVTQGQTVTVELVSVDGGAYTSTLTLSETNPAVALQLGDNNIAQKTDYSFIATQDGTLYTSVKEVYVDDSYTSISDTSIVFKINGVAVYEVDNSYEVKAGDEITVLLSPYFSSETVRGVLYLSYDGFYVHPQGSRGNPYTLNYADCPTNTVEIPAGTAVWYKLVGFSSDAYLTVTGANAYVVVGGQRVDATNGSVTVPAYTNLQIGNAGSTALSYQVSAYIPEGVADNPKDLAEGNNTVTLPERGNYYYDFTAPQAGRVTVTVSGNNWGYQATLLAADGTEITSTGMLYQYNGGTASFGVNMTAGQTVVIKLGTMDSSYTQPGGDITVTFHFEHEGSECSHINATNTWQSDDTNHWQICDNCSQPFNKTAHSTGEWQHDDTNHWKVCGTCNKELNKAIHSYSDGECTCGKAEPSDTCDHSYGEWTDGKKICSKCGDTVICQHPSTTLKNKAAGDCTEDGYTGDTYCTVCGVMTQQGEPIPAPGHEYEDGVCGVCGDPDPNYRAVVSKPVTSEKDATNGVFTVTWDPSKMILIGISVNADYYSILAEDGSVTIGYVSLDGILAGDPIAILYFETVDPADADITVEHKQINNDLPGECSHARLKDPVTENHQEATCMKDGGYDTVVYCAVCGNEVSRTHTKLTDGTHSFTNYVSNGDATYSADGTKTAVCDHGCGAKDTVIDVGSKLAPATITSDVYTINGGMLSKVTAGTTVQQLLENINETGVQIVNGGTVVAGTNQVGTGMMAQLIVNGEVVDQVTIVVTGDINGDGNITITDMLAIKAHVLNKTLLSGAYVKAADTSGDGNATITDFIQIKAFILGKGSITAN